MVEVSVIIPAFNAEKTLGRCLDSVLSQALELEVIVIDDCSTDGTVALCKRYVDRDERVRLLRNSQNIGQGLSRNRGIEVAFGTFLAFVDADDYLAPHMYEDLLSLMRAGNLHIDVAGCALLYPAPNALRGGGSTTRGNQVLRPCPDPRRGSSCPYGQPTGNRREAACVSHIFLHVSFSHIARSPARYRISLRASRIFRRSFL